MTPYHDATVFVVDDDQQARESVSALVRSMGLSTLMFRSAEEFLASYAGQPGCLVTDLRMVGMSGLELQSTLLDRDISLPVIVITAHARTASTVRAIKQGAISLLEKPYEDDELWESLLEALQRDREQREQRAYRQERRRRVDSLTEKERATMELIIAGNANKIIAQRLGVSLRTVESRRHNIFDKTQVNSVAELVQVAYEAQEPAPNIRGT